MFQFGRFAHYMWHVFNMPGCPIRKSPDLVPICRSPELIAAYHVLHRLWEPRHPPCTLYYFLLLICLLRHMVCFFALVMMSHSRLYAGRAQTQQSPIVVCSSFLTSSNMSKNFVKVEARGCKGEGFIVLRLSLCLTLLVKNCGLEPFQMISLSSSVPHGVSSFLNLYVNVHYRSR